MQKNVRRDDLIYPELSYKIIGCAYEVFNELGFGHHEKFYQKALAISFRKNNIEFTEQAYTPLKFHDELLGKLFLDFVVEKTIVVELKKANFYSKKNIDQV